MNRPCKRWPEESLPWFALGNNRLALGQGEAAESAYREGAGRGIRRTCRRAIISPLLMARRGCRTAALALLQSVHAEADSGPYGTEIADSRRENSLAHPRRRHRPPPVRDP